MAKASKQDEEHNLMMRVIFGDPDIKDDKGMKEKVDEMHKILVATQNVSGFFGGVKGTLGWLLLIGAVITTIKGWWAAFFAFILANLAK